MKKIGILGGAFDPPHFGHLIIAEEVYEQLGLDQIWFIPSYDPPHKSRSNTDAEDRVHLVEKAIEGNDHFFINNIEIEREGVSYTYETISILKDQYPGTQFYFIIGGDMVEYLPNWHRIDELAEMIQFVGVKRTGYQLENDKNVRIVDVPGIDISSTLIRERLAGQKSARYLAPDNVLKHIKEYKLYG